MSHPTSHDDRSEPRAGRRLDEARLSEMRRTLRARTAAFDDLRNRRRAGDEVLSDAAVDALAARLDAAVGAVERLDAAREGLVPGSDPAQAEAEADRAWRELDAAWDDTVRALETGGGEARP